MYIIETYTLAVIFCIITMLCWGSWANTQKLAASSWRFELFYWDYVLGILIMSVFFAFTLGSNGAEGRSFLADLQQGEGASINSALLGGILFNLANILLSASIAIAGMAVAFPVGIGLALVIGVVVNYLDAPVGQAGLLFSGVAFIALAILLNAYAYRQLKSSSSQPGANKGLWLALIAGILMGFFYKYVAQSMFPDFNEPLPGKLSPYTAVFLFAIGILMSNVVFNSILMYRPFNGSAVSYGHYFRGELKNHLTGILGGMIWCVGMSFSIIASDKAGPAISYGLGQGATVIAAIWGIFIWKEFKGAAQSTHRLLYIMLGLYILGLALIIGAR